MAVILKDRPIFIIGSERSGTTLLLAILGTHSRIAAPETTWLFPRFYPYLHTYGDLSKEKHLRILANEMLPLAQRWGLKLSWKSAVNTVLQEAKEKSFAGVCDALMQLYAKEVGKPRWVDKTPQNVFFVKHIRDEFPNAQFIHLVRDGRDVAVSFMQAAFGPTNILAAAEAWKLCINAAQPWKKKLNGNDFYEIKYEDLVVKPKQALSELCAFLQESFDPKMLDYWKTDFAKQRARRLDHRRVESPITAEQVGRYKRFLSRYEQEVFAGVARAELEEYGYSIDVESISLSEEEVDILRDRDERFRAVLLTARGGRIRGESYRDWLSDQREARRQAGLWTESDAPEDFPAGFSNEEFITSMRASRRMKEFFSIKREYRKHSKR